MGWKKESRLSCHCKLRRMRGLDLIELRGKIDLQMAQFLSRKFFVKVHQVKARRKEIPACSHGKKSRMTSILKHMKARKRRNNAHWAVLRNKRRRERVADVWTEMTAGGVFKLLPLEVCHLVFSCTSLPALGMLTLTSRSVRDMVVAFVYSSQASECIVPNIDPINETRICTSAMECHTHYRNLGILVKRSSCLFSTKERLKRVGQVLDKLRDSHITICNELGSDLAYSCYGEFLHAFIAGWEYEEKAKAIAAIKGASLLEERMEKVLNSGPGRFPGFERYIRIFCREIFLDKSETSELPFWLGQIVKKWPMCQQANLLFILYGPFDDENEIVQWDALTSAVYSPYSALSELGKILRIMLNDKTGCWNADDVVSLFEELTGVPSEWRVENVAALLAQCGEKFCCEVLGNKAINGRIRELGYLLYHIWQKRFSWNSKTIDGQRKQSEWFLFLVMHLCKLMKNVKMFNEMISQILNIWEQMTFDGLEEYQYISESQREDEDEPIRDRLRSITSLLTTLLVKNARSND